MSLSEALLTLLYWGPMLFLGYRYYIDYYKYEPKVDVQQVIPIAIYIIYGSLIFSFGIDESMEFIRPGIGRSKQFLVFITPGIALSLAAFPYQASELIRNNRGASEHGSYLYFRRVGWLVIILVVIGNIMTLT